MKRIFALFLLCTLLMGSVLPLYAGDDITVTVDGKTLAFDVPPQIVEGRTMVPLRKIFEALGATVNYNTSTRTVISEKDGTKVQLTIGDPNMLVNGTAKTLDVPGMIIDGRTLVPLRAVGEAFGAKVVWNGTTRTATITAQTVTDPADYELLAPSVPGTYEFEKNPGYLEVLAILQNTRKDAVKITFKEQDIDGEPYRCVFMYFVAPEGTGAAIEFTAWDFLPTWREFKAAQTALSQSVRDMFLAKGLDVHCSVVIYHDANNEYMLLQTIDSRVGYDSITGFLK